MPLIRAEITCRMSDSVPADYTTHTVYHQVDDNIFIPGTDWQNHANELRDLFSGIDSAHSNASFYFNRHVQVTVYDMADPKPRPEKATATNDPVPQPKAEADLGPRQVALVLAFYGTRNLPRQRGHIYLGPFNQTDVGGSRPSTTLLSQALDLGHGLFDIGGENVKHIVHSEVSALDTTVQNYWVDDSWDTQRRRKNKSTTRQKLAP